MYTAYAKQKPPPNASEAAIKEFLKFWKKGLDIVHTVC